MSDKEQEKIIQELRSKAVKVKVAETSPATKIDKQTVWKKAKKAGKTISDDSLSAPHPAGA